MRRRSGSYRTGFDPLDIGSFRRGTLRTRSGINLAILLLFVSTGLWSSADEAKRREASMASLGVGSSPSGMGALSSQAAPVFESLSLLGAGYIAPEPKALEALPLADLDPLNNREVAPPAAEPECALALERLGAQVTPADLPLKQQVNGTFTCGSPQAFVFKRGPLGVRYNARPIVTCRMALGLAHFERIANELAEEHLGEPIARITQLGTYSCRRMARFRSLVSEHAYANAIDIKSIALKRSGRIISVEKHFGALTADESTASVAPLKREAKFLRALSRRLYQEGVFSVVLTPFYDKLHRDHFHLDQARYRIDGTGGRFEWPSLFRSR